jgi:alpha-mannosidase
LRGTANTSRELPVVDMGRSVNEFFDHLKTSSDAGRKLPNWCVSHFACPFLAG